MPKGKGLCAIKLMKYCFPIHHIPSKRIFDIFFSLFALVFISPLFISLCVTIIFTSPGPIFYTSKRIGRGGQIIRCWKFRTMHKDAEKKLNDLLAKNFEYKKQWEKYHKIQNDPRITPIGYFLRKTSLDELPQFINVLLGELSVVGPRAFAPEGPTNHFHEEIRKYLGNNTEKILSIRPGLTGIWQVSGRNNLTIQQRVALEASYIDNRSFLGDINIIFKTIPVMIFSKGAY